MRLEAVEVRGRVHGREAEMEGVRCAGRTRLADTQGHWCGRRCWCLWFWGRCPSRATAHALQGELSAVHAQAQVSQGGCRCLPSRQGQAHLSCEANLAAQQAPLPSITSSHLAVNFPVQLAVPELSSQSCRQEPMPGAHWRPDRSGGPAGGKWPEPFSECDCTPSSFSPSSHT